MQLFESKNLIKSEHQLKRYFKFISFFINYPKEKYKTESHHIYPKCYFPELDQNLNYKVNLPKRVHFIAHQMLALAIGGKMWQSFQLMGRIQNHKSHHYEKFKNAAIKYNNDSKKKEKISKTVKKLWENSEYRENQILKKKEYIFTDEHKQNLSQALKGVKKPDGFGVGRRFSDATKLKISKSQKGIKNSNITPKTVFKSDNTPFVTILYNFSDVCKELNLPTSLGTTYKNNNKLYDHQQRNCDISKLKNEGKYQFKGWYVRSAK